MKTIYLCDSSIEGILSGVYTAWASGRGMTMVSSG